MSGMNLIGQKLGEFEIKEKLGEGAMASVYLAAQPSVNNRLVALKVIRLDNDHEAGFRNRFAHEAAIIAQLEHIHILPVYAYGIAGDYAYLAMRWLQGGTLAQVMRNEDLSLERIADILKQVAAGLTYAHKKGIIHRDLKPSNIMLDDAGHAHLTDFGLAKVIQGSQNLTLSGTVVGTPAYMSPEQLRGDPLDRRSDIYSLGVILYNLVVGRLPFDTATSDIVTIIYQQLEKAPPRPRTINPDINPEVETVILRALAKAPGERYDSAVELAQAFNAALGLPGSSEQSVPQLPQLLPNTPVKSYPAFLKRVRPLVAVVVMLVAVALFLVIALLTRPAQPTGGRPYTILAGESSPAAEVSTPNEDEIAAARAYLGDGGFIAYLACTRDSEFHATLARAMHDLATRYQLRIEVYDPQTDNYRQVTQIEQARSDGARALILCPLDVELLSESLKSVEATGLPLVIFGDNIPSYGGVLMGGDNYELGLVPGQLAGQIIHDEMDGQADVIILDFPDRQDITERADGLEAGLLEFAPEATIVGRFRGATREFAYESIKKLIDTDVHFNVIVSINDAGSFGAIQAMEDADFDPNSVVITSIDAEALALEYIRDGYFIRGSARISPTTHGETLLNIMVRLLAGASLPEVVISPPAEMVTSATLTSAKQ